MKKDFEILNMQLSSLVVFRGLLDDPVLSKFRNLLFAISDSENQEETISCYSSFVAALYKKTSDWSKYIERIVLDNDNIYIEKMAAGDEVTDAMNMCLESELALFSKVASVTPDDVKSAINYYQYLPTWDTSKIDLNTSYKKRTKNVLVEGYGIYREYNAFRVTETGEIVPVKYPDTQRPDELFGYERERSIIIKNTEALLAGKGSNMLLYGDAGTGKSSTIKAVADHYADKGLRLVEMKKDRLHLVSEIIEKLSANPLKFILFIDDLSFSGNDDNFSALKATLEGSIVAGNNNIAVYATSNRRHLIRESMSDRSGDDVHVNDTLQETMSLAARFSLTVTFERPSKEEYLEIVKALAEKYGLDMPEGDLFAEAEAFAIRSNGRTPRAAKQFVELKKMGL